MEPLVQFEQSPQIKKLFWTSVGFLVLTLLVFFRLALTGLEELGWARVLWTFVVSSSIPLGLLIRLLFRIRPILYARYSLYEDQLNVSQGSLGMQLKFTDLYQVRFPLWFSRFWGGFTLFHQSGQRLRILSTLKGSEEILSSISKNRPGFITDKEVENYRIQIRLQEISWPRLFEKLKSFKALLLKYVGLALVLGVLVGLFTEVRDVFGFELKWLDIFLIVFIFQFFLGLFLNAVEEKILYQIYKRSVLAENFQRNLETEKKLSSAISIFYVCLSLATAAHFIYHY